MSLDAKLAIIRRRLSDPGFRSRVAEPELTDDEKQELYSRGRPLKNRWNANHEGHDWRNTPIHPGSGCIIVRCFRCGCAQLTNGETPKCWG